MANTSRTIKVIFDGSVAGLKVASEEAKRAIKSVADDNDNFIKKLEKADGPLTNFSTGFVKIAAKAGAGAQGLVTISQAAYGLTQIVSSLAPGLLVLPGIILGGAAAFSVFKLATSGVGDALKGTAGALDKLSPSAKTAVQAVLAFKPAFADIKTAVQDNFFQGFNDQIKQTGSVLLPVLKAQLPSIASGFNGIGLEAIKAAGTPFFTGAVSSILGNTSTAMGNLRTVAASALTGFVGLGTVGAQYLPQIATAVDHVAERFSNWVQTGLKDGSLQTFVNNAIATFKELEAIVKNVGSIIGSVFSGLGASISSGGGLDALKQTTAALAAFFKTAQAQDALKALGTVIQALADAFRGVLLEALHQIAPAIVAIAPFVVQLAQSFAGVLIPALQAAGPFLLSFATFLSNNAGLIAPIVLGIVALGLAFGAIASVAGTIVSVAASVTAIGSAVGIVGGILAEVGSAIAGLSGILFGAITAAGGFGAIFGSIFAGIAAVVTAPVTLIVAAIALIGAGLVLAYNHCAVFRDFVDTTFQQVGQTVTSAIAFFTSFGDGVNSAISAVIGFFSNLPSTISSAFSSVTSFLGSVPGLIGGALSSLGSTIASVASSAWQGFIAAAQVALNFIISLPELFAVGLGTFVGTVGRIAVDAWNGFITATTAAFAFIVGLVTTLPTMVITGLAQLGALIGTAATAAWNFLVTATTTAITSVIAFVTALPGRAAAALASLAGAIGGAATNAWNAVKAAFTAGVAAAVSFAQSLPGKVTSAISSLVSSLQSTATNAWNALKSAFTTGINNAVAFVQTFPGKVIAILQGLVSKMASLGAGIIQGIISGLESAAGSLFSYFTGLANKALAAAKSAFSQNSPSRLFIPVGAGVTEGIEVGAASRVGNLVTGIQNIAAAAIGAVKPMASQVSALFGAGGALDIPNFGSLNATLRTTNEDATGSGQVAQQHADLASAISQAVMSAVKLLPAPNVNVSAKLGTAELKAEIETHVENQFREVKRNVSAGAGVSF